MSHEAKEDHMTDIIFLGTEWALQIDAIVCPCWHPSTADV